MFSKQAGKCYSKLKQYILKFLNYHIFLLDFSNSILYDIAKNSGLDYVKKKSRLDYVEYDIFLLLIIITNHPPSKNSVNW
jgi:hypothetical protein